MIFFKLHLYLNSTQRFKVFKSRNFYKKTYEAKIYLCINKVCQKSHTSLHTSEMIQNLKKHIQSVRE